MKPAASSRRSTSKRGAARPQSGGFLPRQTGASDAGARFSPLRQHAVPHDDLNRKSRCDQRAGAAGPKPSRDAAGFLGWMLSPERRGPLLIAPAIATLFIVNIFPLMWSFGLSFFEYKANRIAAACFQGPRQLRRRSDRSRTSGSDSSIPRPSSSAASRCS